MSFNIQAKIGADGSGFFREMNRVKQAASGLASSAISGFGIPLGAAAGAGALSALGAKAVEYAGTLTDMSERLGVSTDALQEFDHGLSLSGGTLDDAAAALKKLASARDAALRDGGSEQFAAFAKLGVTAEQLKSARLEDLFRQIGRSIRDASDPQAVLADAMLLLGKNSDAVLTAMRADLDAAAESARNLGLVISEDVIAKLDELGDATDTFGRRLLAAFAPALVVLVNGLNNALDLMRIYAALFGGGLATVVGVIFGGGDLQTALDRAIEQAELDIDEILQDYERRNRPPQRRDRQNLNLEATEREGGANLALREAERVLQLRERISKMERDALPAAERRVAIEREIARLIELQALRAEEGAVDDVAQAELRLRQLELEKELRGLEARDGSQGSRMDRNVDALARVGIFMGGAPVGVRTTPLTGEHLSREVSRLGQIIRSGNAEVVSAVRRNEQATKEVFG